MKNISKSPRHPPSLPAILLRHLLHLAHVGPIVLRFVQGEVGVGDDAGDDGADEGEDDVPQSLPTQLRILKHININWRARLPLRANRERSDCLESEVVVPDNHLDGKRRILHTPISILGLSAVGSLLVAADGIGAVESHNHEQGL